MQTTRKLNWTYTVKAFKDQGCTHVVCFGPTTACATRTARVAAGSGICVITANSDSDTVDTFDSAALLSPSVVSHLDKIGISQGCA